MVLGGVGSNQGYWEVWDASRRIGGYGGVWDYGWLIGRVRVHGWACGVLGGLVRYGALIGYRRRMGHGRCSPHIPKETASE